MEGLLLGGLSYIGNKIGNENKNENKDKDYLYNRNVYNTDIENQMNYIESNQAKTIKTPEFFKQFDSLTFDNLSIPSGINESYITKNGFNQSLQQDLNFKNGYSEFENTDMHYNVINRENFVHNNMYPNTSRRDTMVNLELNNRKFENLSGNNSTFFHKREVDTFFEPNSYGSNVHGLPNVTGELTSRYVTSYKNQNGNLPFQTQQRVLPGIDGKVSAPYAVTRIDPRNIDELRSEINKKTSYLTKPLETIKKGELRGVNPVITAFKMPTYRNITTKDLVANKHDVEGPKKTGKFIHIETDRGHTEYDTCFVSGIHDSNQGYHYNSYIYNDPKKENYINDFTHSINAVNSRPVFTNISSYCNYQTDRGNNDSEIRASGMYNNNNSSYYIDINNTTKPTLRESMNYDNPSNVSSIYHTGYTNIQDDAKNTIRETTNYDNPSNIFSTYQSGYTNIQDDAKTTIKETTNYDNPSNISSTYQTNYTNIQDDAKTTIKETTNYDNPSNIASTYKIPYKSLNDTAKTTIKETTNYDNPSNLTSMYKNTNIMLQDDAKTTIKETTNYDNPSNISSIYQTNNIILQDDAKTTIRETTNYDDVSNLAPIYHNPYTEQQDQVRNTIKQTLLHSTPGGRMYNNNEANYKSIENAKTTIKETTLITDYTGTSTHNINGPRIEHAERNMTIQDKRQQTALGGRISNPKSDQIRGDINRDTFRFQDKRTLLRGYVTHGNISTNYLGMNNCTNHKTDLNSNNFYRIDPIYIETLDNNPLVNDIKHPKNINFN